ncbi:hypothetical protein FI667_g1047, partial [Globisporangium splendens]
MVFGVFTRRATQQSARAAVRSASTAFEAQFGAQSVVARQTRQVAAQQQQHHRIPEHYANDVTGIVAGVAIVGAIVGVGKMWWDASSAPASAGNKYSPVAFEEIPHKEMTQFFAELITNVQALFKQIPEIENAMHTYMKSNNIELDDNQFKQALMQQLYQMMEALEQEIVGKRQWSRQSLEAAFEKFAEDAEILALQQELQQIMQSVFPAPEPVDVPDHMTAEKTLEIFTSLVNGMETALKDMLAHAKTEGITNANKAMEEFQHLYLEQVEQLSEALMKTHGITQEKAVQEDDKFRQQVEAIYAKQAKTFRNLGLDVADP